MVLPLEMFRAAQSGDRDAVLAYLYPQDDSGDARDVNEQTEEGGSILMGAVSQIDSAAKLKFVWELVNHGADLHSVVDPESRATKDAADPIVAHVLRLPNELCWHVLEFWRVESEVTGEVI